MNTEFYAGLSPAHQTLVDWAASIATESGRAIEAGETGLPALAAKMEVIVVSPTEQAKFAAAAQPADRALIEKQYGAEGVDMLSALLGSIDEEKAKF
jgi:TRAP-type C4-dicarboxylate transport system substrate-binding protein